MHGLLALQNRFHHAFTHHRQCLRRSVDRAARDFVIDARHSIHVGIAVIAGASMAMYLLALRGERIAGTG